MKIRDNKALTIVSWALYDFANAIFAMNVIALYFVLWVTVEKGAEDIVYSLVLGGSMFLAAITMPLLGAVSDKRGKRIPFLIFFTVLCVLFLFMIGLTESLILGLIFFAIANFGYLIAGAVFYNALLPVVADADKIGRISGFGICLSYAGTITGLFLIRPIALKFGYQATFIPTALLFLLFSLPCFLFVKDKVVPGKGSVGKLIEESFKQLFVTLKDVRSSRELSRFFLAIFIIINIVNSVFIFMSVYLKKVFFFSDSELFKLYIFSNIFSLGGAISAGFISDKIGARKTFVGAIIICSVAILMGVTAISKIVFWAVGPMVGIAFSSIRVSGRALAVELFPKEKIGEIFGHLGFVSNLAFMGLFLWGAIVYVLEPLGTGRYRVALFSMFIVLMFGVRVLIKSSGGADVKGENRKRI